MQIAGQLGYPLRYLYFLRGWSRKWRRKWGSHSSLPFIPAILLLTNLKEQTKEKRKGRLNATILILTYFSCLFYSFHLWPKTYLLSTAISLCLSEIRCPQSFPLSPSCLYCLYFLPEQAILKEAHALSHRSANAYCLQTQLPKKQTQD